MKNQKMTLESPYYQAIIDASYSGIIAINAKGVVSVCNKEARRILRWEDREVVGMHCKELLSDLWPDYRKILKTGAPQLGLKVKRHNLTLMVNRTPIVVKDKIAGVVSTFHDISELELQLKRSKRLTKEYYSKLEKIRMQQNKLDDIVVVSEEMKDVIDLAQRVSKTDVPVLLQGETGVGKEVVAKLIHKLSGRSTRGMFMKINCGAIPENLLESELFGYERGSFTGANQSGKKGLLELAEKGTLSLDEIETLSLNLQAKLLSAVQDLEIIRVGGVKPKKINSRIIASSNQDLYQMVQNRTFREDLFFRLNVVTISVPPLRERKDDILPLANHFLRKYNKKYRKEKHLSRLVVDCLMGYRWKGNVRELAHLMEHLVVMTQEDRITLDDLPQPLRSFERIGPASFNLSEISSFKRAVLEFEYKLIREAISSYGNARKAARFLKLDPSTITRKIKKFETIDA